MNTCCDPCRCCHRTCPTCGGSGVVPYHYPYRWPRRPAPPPWLPYLDARRDAARARK